MLAFSSIQLTEKTPGKLHVGNDAVAIAKANELLQRNHEEFHMIYTDDGRHNHILHHLLAAYALGATGDELEKAFRQDLYQRPRPPVNEQSVAELGDKTLFPRYLDHHDNFTTFLEFFKREISQKGVASALEEHLLDKTPHANAMLCRFYSSIFHPVIHIGYGLEYYQPVIVAESLAQAAIHCPYNDIFIKFLLTTEDVSGKVNRSGPPKTFRQILDEMAADERVRTAYKKATEFEISRDVIRDEFDAVVKYTSQYTVAPETLTEQIMEMYDVITSTLTVGADTPSSFQTDFFLLHAVNVVSMFPAMQNHPWIKGDDLARIVEWQGRILALLYVAPKSPPISSSTLHAYTGPFKPWKELYQTAINHSTDDGHLLKIVRALALGQNFTAPLRSQGNAVMEEDAWLKLANLVVSSAPEAVESEDRWKYNEPR